MSTSFSELPANIQKHLKSLLATFGLTDSEESYERMAQGWLEKEKGFETEISNRGMDEVNELEMSDTRGSVALTYSGSLVLIGPEMDGARKVGYYSIGARKDVPDASVKENSKLASEIKVDHPIEFEAGPVQKTSSIFKIAVCKFELAPVEQEEMLTDVTVFLADQFAEINRSIIIKE